MVTRKGPDSSGELYDARANPRRGVRVRPLPRPMRRRFAAYMAEYRVYVQSQLSTWRLAHRDQPNDAFVGAHLIYWSSVLKCLDHIEYLGTHNDTGRRA